MSAALTPAGEAWVRTYTLAVALFGDEVAQAMAFTASDHARNAEYTEDQIRADLDAEAVPA